MNSRPLKNLLLAACVILIGCADHKPPGTAAKTPDASSCVNTISELCPKTSTSAAQNASAEKEVTPFYEGTTPTEISEEKEPAKPVEKIIGEEAEAEIGKIDVNKIPTFDIPIVINAHVEKWIHYFQTNGRKVFTAWLSRSEKYIPMMRRILRENGLPEDLVYLAMIESGFKPYAYSRAKASGPWQFIKGTGSRYGLRVTWWVDERRDPEKSSIAAAQHLKDLYDQFNSWYLAAASYNAGARKIEKAIERYSTEDFWEMSKYRYLKAETKDYVPKMIAAALIAKEPERYGFEGIKYDDPLEYDKVLVPEPTELAAIASVLKISHDTLSELNPELRRDITPPDMPNYELNVPKGFKEKFVGAYPDIRKKSVTTVARHVVKRGETLSTISRKYGVDTGALASFNRLPSHRVKPGLQLAIPYRGPEETVRRVAYKLPKGQKSNYVIRPGDTLWSISRRFGVTVTEIREWNDLSHSSSVRPGQKVKLYARSDPEMLVPAKETPPQVASNPTDKGWTTYRVQSGDSLWNIAKKFSVSTADIMKWNQLSADDKIRPGMELKIRIVSL